MSSWLIISSLVIAVIVVLTVLVEFIPYFLHGFKRDKQYCACCCLWKTRQNIALCHTKAHSFTQIERLLILWKLYNTYQHSTVSVWSHLSIVTRPRLVYTAPAEHSHIFLCRYLSIYPSASSKLLKRPEACERHREKELHIHHNSFS